MVHIPLPKKLVQRARKSANPTEVAIDTTILHVLDDSGHYTA